MTANPPKRTTGALYHRAVTLRRRQILLALATLPACTKHEQPAPQPDRPSTKPSWPRTTTHAGVEMIELFPNDADETSPFVVVIHGMGDRPQPWVEGWKHFPGRAHVVLPRAFTPYSGGFSWFDYEPNMTEEKLGVVLGEAETKLWPAILEVAAGREVIATGFSQGGMLSFTIAARHADRVTHAFPISGACPTSLRPTGKAAPVLALHGTADTMVNIQRARDAVAAFRAAGNQAELKEYPGVGHTITQEMRADWYAALQKAITAA